MNKFLSLLGLARRAGKLVAGYDATINLLKEKKASLIVIATDISEKTEKNIKFEAEKTDTKTIKVEYTIEEISSNIGKKAGVLAISDKDFTKGLLTIFEYEKG